GAQGVGEACTEAFVSSFMMILFLNYVFTVVFDAIYKSFWSVRPLL
ncbi:MAG: ABC transporter permease, partial [Planctomycetota bacterium]